MYEVTLKSFEKVRAGPPCTPHAALTLCPWRGCATAPAEVKTSARITVFLICSCVLVCFIFLAQLQGWFSYLFLTLFLLYFFFFFLSPWAAQKKSIKFCVLTGEGWGECWGGQGRGLGTAQGWGRCCWVPNLGWNRDGTKTLCLPYAGERSSHFYFFILILCLLFKKNLLGVYFMLGFFHSVSLQWVYCSRQTVLYCWAQSTSHSCSGYSAPQACALYAPSTFPIPYPLHSLKFSTLSCARPPS